MGQVPLAPATGARGARVDPVARLLAGGSSNSHPAVTSGRPSLAELLPLSRTEVIDLLARAAASGSITWSEARRLASAVGYLHGSLRGR
jgi:hypothetical protein